MTLFVLLYWLRNPAGTEYRPIIVDDFKSKVSCEAFAAELYHHREDRAGEEWRCMEKRP